MFNAVYQRSWDSEEMSNIPSDQWTFSSAQGGGTSSTVIAGMGRKKRNQRPREEEDEGSLVR